MEGGSPVPHPLLLSLPDGVLCMCLSSILHVCVLCSIVRVFCVCIIVHVQFFAVLDVHLLP